MAIEKKLIHFKKWSDFSSKKLSANEQNTQYTLGVDGALTTGAPDILYQSICWIKDVRKMWTHGAVYDCSGGANADLSNYVTQAELDELVEFVDDMNSDISNLINTKQENITDLQAIREGAAKGATSVQPSDLADVATSGSYNDLSDKPTIPSAVTESTVSGWGFTKNTGTYSKPSGGIPTTDLASDVQSALVAAESYKGTVIGVKANNTTKMPNAGIVDLGTVGTYSKPSTGIPKSDLDTSVQASLGKADTAVQPEDLKDEVYIADFTMYSLRTGMNSGTDVDCNIQALVTAMNANKVILVREDENLEGVHVLNGFAEDLLYFSIVDSSGNILWCDGVNYIESQGIAARTLHLQDWWKKQDTLVSGENIKTINGESILGSGDITISGSEGDYLPSTGGTVDGDLIVMGAIASPTLIQATGGVKGYLRSGDDFLGIEGERIVWGKEADGHFITAKGDGTKFLSDDGTYKTISGGGGSSSGGSGAYSEVNHGTSDTTFTLTPNTFHVWDEVANLTLTLGSETSGVANEFLFQFTSGATATTLTLPDDIKWANDSSPTIAENMIYQVSILKGMASVLEFNNPPAIVPIVFYVNGNPYNAMSNMTWIDFINSDYNPDVYNEKMFIAGNYGEPKYAGRIYGEDDIEYYSILTEDYWSVLLTDKILSTNYIAE